MSVLKPARTTKSVVLTLSLVMLSLTAYAATVGTPPAPSAKPIAPSGKPAAPSPKPRHDGGSWQVAKGIDHIIQPRFQQSGGRFGMDRVESSIDGHPNVELLFEETGSEKRRVKRITELKRPYVIGILHCAHKPGSHVGENDRNDLARVSRPSTQPLVTADTSDKRAVRSWGWAAKHLDRIAVPYAHRLVRGQSVEMAYGKWDVVIRPIRAEGRKCLSCHVGAKRGDTLGAMIYAVQRGPSSGKPTHYWTGGGV